MADDLQARQPGLDIAPGTLLDVLIDIEADQHAQTRQLATEVLAIIFKYYGQSILRIPQNDATSATGLTTWVRVDTADFPLASPLTVTAGTQITLAGADPTERIAFQTVDDFTFPGGTATATNVAIVASVAGADGSGLSADPQPENTLVWLSSITVTGVTTGGQDAEDDDTYLDRLADLATLQGTTLVLPSHFATFARNQTGVDRALAIDNYDPPTPDGTNLGTGQAGHITVALQDQGLAVGSTVKAAVKAALVANAQTNLTVHTIDPTYTLIKVVFAGVAAPGYDKTDVQTRAVADVLAFLDPAQWGVTVGGDIRDWQETNIVRFQDVSTVLNNVAGFDHWSNVTGTATTTSGSANLTVVTPTTGWVNGMAISGTGIPGGTTILSGAGTATMVMSANATASASGVAITGQGLTINGGTADVTMTGHATLPDPASTAAGSVV